jgi:hypothetical protein
MLRALLVAGVALGLLAGLASPAGAAPRRAPSATQNRLYVTPSYLPLRKPRLAAPLGKGKAEPKKEIGFGPMPKGPLQIVVAVNTQKVTLYSNGERVAQGSVSTGTASHPTPLGVFSIIEKDRHHRSNIYSGAPMPFMQRVTWSGVALHEGVLPGYPASHGCIRMSHDFAQKLWPVTRLGVRVFIARDDLAPRDFAHAKLFSPKQKPPPEITTNATTDEPAPPIRLARATMTDAGSAEPDPPKPAAQEHGPADSAAPVVVNSEEVRATESVASAEAETARPVETADETAGETGTIRPASPAAEVPILDDLRKAVELPRAHEAMPASPAAVEAPPGAQDIEKPAPTDDPGKPAVAPRTKAADQPVKRSGQVAVFVSRKEKKIFVRQGFIPLFEMPVTFAEPDRPLGTHVLTAMGFTDQGAGMRWNLITVPSDTSPVVERREPKKTAGKAPRAPPRPTAQLKPMVQPKPPSTAAEALDRIQMPPEAIERIAELLIPGSSLVVSDEGLGKETGRYTEFIVLTR